MFEWLDGTWTECQSQRSYHDAIMSAAAKLGRYSAYVRKWGLHEGFLGDGRIARVAVDVAPAATPSGSSEDAWARVSAQ